MTEIYDLSQFSTGLQDMAAGMVADGQLVAVTATLTLKDGTKRQTTVHVAPSDIPRIPTIVEMLESNPDPARNVLFLPD